MSSVQKVNGAGKPSLVTSVNGQTGDVTVAAASGVTSVDGNTGPAVVLTGTYLALTGGTLTGALVGTLSTMTTGVRAGASLWATTGEVRLPSLGSINGRTAANSADVAMLSLNSSDKVAVGADLVPASDAVRALGVSSLRWATVAVANGVATGSSPAATGALRLSSTQAVTSRNNAGTGDISLLASTASDQAQVGADLVPGADATRVLGTSSLRWASVAIANSVTFGSTPAASGTVRFSSTNQLTSRNAGGSADISLLQANASDQAQIGADVVPGSDALRALGTSALRWASVAVANSISVGTSPAQSGALRAANGGALAFRNGANSADIAAVFLNASDVLGLTGGTGGTVLQYNGTTMLTVGASAASRITVASGNAFLSDFVRVNATTGSLGTVEKLRANTPTTVDNAANAVLAASAATAKPLILQGAASQTANLLEAQNSAGGVGARITAGAYFQGLLSDTGGLTGNVYLNATGQTSNPTFYLRATQATAVAQITKGFTAQTADLSQWQDATPVTVFAISAAGLPQWAAAASEQTTVGAAGAAGALPATPTKYLKVKDSAGTTLVIPAYAAA